VRDPKSITEPLPRPAIDQLHGRHVFALGQLMHEIRVDEAVLAEGAVHVPDVAQATRLVHESRHLERIAVMREERELVEWSDRVAQAERGEQRVEPPGLLVRREERHHVRLFAEVADPQLSAGQHKQPPAGLGEDLLGSSHHEMPVRHAPVVGDTPHVDARLERPFHDLAWRGGDVPPIVGGNERRVVVQVDGVLRHAGGLRLGWSQSSSLARRPNRRRRGRGTC